MRRRRCPPLAELERFVEPAGATPDPPTVQHLAGCRTCAARLAAVRAGAHLEARIRRISPMRGLLPRIEGYEVTGVLAEGGQSRLLEARRVSSGARVALKVFRHWVPPSRQPRARLQERWQALADLRHPNLVAVHGGGITEDDRPYLVMELVDGEVLDGWLARHRPGLRTRLERILEITEAIAHAHAAGLLHGDLKPTSVLVDRTGRSRVIDLAGVFLADDPTRGEGPRLGTPPYVAPEVLTPDPPPAGIPQDVYALGVLLYEVLTGRHPFADATGLAALVAAITEGTPAAPSTVAHELDAHFDPVVLQAMARDPARRPASASAFHAELRRAAALAGLHGLTARSARRDARREPRRARRGPPRSPPGRRA